MTTFFKKRHPPVGSRPGTLVLPHDAVAPVIRVIQYDAARVTDQVITDTGAACAMVRPAAVTWIDVQGLGDERVLRTLAGAFEIHPLALEDVANAPQRPKIEAYDRHLLVITRMLRLTGGGDLDLEQVSLFIGDAYVLSVQERYGDVLDPVRRRIDEGKGVIRASGADYLAYALLDTIVDAYYPVIVQVGEDLVRLEQQVMRRPTRAALTRLNALKGSLAVLNRTIVPQREALTRLIRDGSRFITPEVRTYLRDTFDHCAQLADVVDGDRDSANGLLNTYVSLVGMRTNDVMKVLTIMASIFIPLTFLAGIYGMNFEGMPELHEPWAYPVLLAVMLACAAGMLFYFRRRGWIGDEDVGDDRDD